jgi:pimeloyl-ACP methyl ester carboxylesterase
MLRAFGDTLFGEQQGVSPARVLALPGWMRRRTDFDTVLSGLDAIALDLPGFGGASPPPEQPTGSAGYARFVEPALDVCAPGVVLVGHSFGGRVAVHLAADHPDKVGAVVLAGVPNLYRDHAPKRPPLSYRAVRRLHAWRLVSDARMEALRLHRGSDDYRNATGVM